jgi:hypothetical protein
MLKRQSPTAKAIKRSRCVTALYLIGESKSSVTMAASVTAPHHRFIAGGTEAVTARDQQP